MVTGLVKAKSRNWRPHLVVCAGATEEDRVGVQLLAEPDDVGVRVKPVNVFLLGDALTPLMLTTLVESGVSRYDAGVLARHFKVEYDAASYAPGGENEDVCVKFMGQPAPEREPGVGEG